MVKVLGHSWSQGPYLCRPKSQRHEFVGSPPDKITSCGFKNFRSMSVTSPSTTVWKEVARSDTWMVMGWKTCFTGMAGSDQPPEVLEQSAAALASEHCDKKKKLAGPAWGVERFTTPNLTHQGLCSPKVAPPTNTDKTSAWAKGGRTFQKRSQQRHGSRQQGERELGLWMSHQCWIGN